MTQRTSSWLKQNFQDTDPQDFMDDMVDTFNLARLGIIGSVFYVDPTLSATAGDGQSPENAFATMQEGIDACTDRAGDIVLRMPGTEQITTPVLFNKRGITVMASYFGASALEGTEDSFSTYADASFTDGPVGIISAPCRILGLLFASRNTVDAAANQAAGSSAALAIDDSVAGINFVEITGCRFPRWWANVALVKVIGSSYGLVQKCTFEQNGAAGGIGVWYTSGPTHNPGFNKVYDSNFIRMAAAVEYQAGTGSDANELARNTTKGCTLFLDTNGETSSPESIAHDNVLDFVNAAASFDQANIAALEAIGWRYMNNHYRET